MIPGDLHPKPSARLLDFLILLAIRLVALPERRRVVAGPLRKNQNSQSVFCPRCNAKGSAQPVMSPMGVLFVEGGRPATCQPFTAPHFTYVCPRCSYSEIHERLIDSTYR